jgi:hypothetical protein
MLYQAERRHFRFDGSVAMVYRYKKTPIEGVLSDFNETVTLHKVDETKWERLWDEIVREHHYLGYESMIGCRIKYLVTLGRQLVGAISFCSAAYKLGPRDRYIGWDEATRLAMLPHLVNNNRFLILPWIRIKNLASHVLSVSLKRLRADWLTQYGVEPYMAETFVDRQVYDGVSYRAANWSCLGTTQGYGKQGNTFVHHGRPKEIYVKIMNRRFTGRFRLDRERLKKSLEEEMLTMLNGIPMLATYREELGGFLFHPEGMITGDGCDFPKKGKSSVGVKRQYCGVRGKTDNCQASVVAGYAGPNGYGLLDYALYMDHYEVRTWHGWRRHILITLIAHFFVIKMRSRMSVRPWEPGAAPYVDSPIPLADYLDAYMLLQKGEAVTNPHIMAVPDRD